MKGVNDNLNQPKMTNPEVKRLNADIPKELKIRLDVFCAKEDLDIKVVTALALESFLDEMETRKGVT